MVRHFLEAQKSVHILLFGVLPLCFFLSALLFMTQQEYFQGSTSFQHAVNRTTSIFIGTSHLQQRDDVVGDDGEKSNLTVNDNSNQNRQSRPLIKTISMLTTATDVNESWSSSNNQQLILNHTQHSTDFLLSNTTNDENSPTTLTTAVSVNQSWSSSNNHRPILQQHGTDFLLNITNDKHHLPTTLIIDNHKNSDPIEDIIITTTTKSFYRWESANGIPMEPLWHYIISLALPNSPREPFGPLPGYIDPQATLKASMRVYHKRSQTVLERAIFIGPFIQDALYYFYNRSSAGLYNQTQVMFPYLSQALRDGGLPFVFNFQDYHGCFYQNYEYTPFGENVSTLANLPMLTLSYSPLCNHTFPIPSYTTVRLAKRHPDEWNTAFNQSDTLYPWNTKIKKAVWRGTISGMGQYQQSPLDVNRVHINYLAKLHPDILDVAIPCTPMSNCRGIKQSWREYLVLGDYIPFADFQKYRAVLDLDGNSWSERFPRLLCQNSVVIKLDPFQIDYFWPTLQAGVHYVAANITNLVSVVQYVVSDAHQTEMQAIVANAHEWCQQHMVQWDILSLLDSYAHELYKGDPLWHRHITRLGKLNLQPPPKWQHHPVSAWNTTF